ncbi:aromatic ring-hydroxylating dioxygenase subunit alpha [Streptomyces sp. VNUA24]|uniref:aromatic ring-hydroxylating oxygenase subunit alpha n=1 Tax=Streptomyces sp. VNUA24 TaxID=3031131 RepID=UPI0023B777DD|nr:aromatic ring-hydroxylating dioxygenase subunit alpha [Streptomyces sp. VNUA24]WEH12923.1 aromatic ring-hydroxylating dioxygenase subunit alpha [Streptomyces sp. VNUA24]
MTALTSGPKELVGHSAKLLAEGMVDRRIYSDPEIYRMEQELVFARSWLVVGHDTQIPRPGDFIESYMGEESVIVTRNREGDIRVMLNTCRHRGNKVCRAELGTTRAFMCQYHGWTYDIDGNFVGAPQFEKVYQDDLDKSKWGLHRARVALYKGLIFATFDTSLPPLEEFLGDFTWLLDMSLDPRPGGVEVAGGFLRWNIRTNWKFGAENSGGDLYHGGTTHRSAVDIGHRAIATGKNDPKHATDEELDPGGTMTSSFGHGVNWSDRRPEPEGGAHVPPDETPLARYLRENRELTRQHLGDFRSRTIRRFNANIFPNAGFHSSAQTIHIFHPRGPGRSEVWLIPLVDKAAPQDVKDWVRRHTDSHFGPGGFFEEDDGENWEQATAATRGVVASRLPFNYQMGFGREKVISEPGVPDRMDGGFNDYGQRALLERWHDMMRTP